MKYFVDIFITVLENSWKVRIEEYTQINLFVDDQSYNIKNFVISDDFGAGVVTKTFLSIEDMENYIYYHMLNSYSKYPKLSLEVKLV